MCAGVQSENRNTLTELAALPYEARPARALAGDVVAVGPVLAATHLSALRPVETGGTA